MRFSRWGSFILTPLCLPLIVAVVFAGQSSCPAGKQPLWYYPEAGLDGLLETGFADSLFADLEASLTTMGYCLRRYAPDDSAVRPDSAEDNLLMYIFVRYAAIGDSLSSDGEKELFAALARLKELPAGGGNDATRRPLFSLRCALEDMKTIRAIFVKKLIENFRTQYICNVAVATDPSGVLVRADNGLADKTPFEWVLPVGALRIRCSADGYLPKEEEISFTKPGSYRFFLQMKKRQFYHSKFIYPAAAAAVSSVLCAGFEYYYYDRYWRLGDHERVTNPGLFETTFRKARTFERLAAASLAVSGVFLVFCFTF